MTIDDILQAWGVLSIAHHIVGAGLLLRYGRRWWRIWRCYRILARVGLADELLRDPVRTRIITEHMARAEKVRRMMHENPAAPIGQRPD